MLWSFWLTVIALLMLVAVAWGFVWAWRYESRAKHQWETAERLLKQEVIYSSTLPRWRVNNILDGRKKHCDKHPDRIATAVRADMVEGDHFRVAGWMCDSCFEKWEEQKKGKP